MPVTIGLIASSALIIARASDHDWSAFAVTAAAFALATWTRLSPLLCSLAPRLSALQALCIDRDLGDGATTNAFGLAAPCARNNLRA